MFSKDDMAVAEEQFQARREELTRRAQELRERFTESVDEDLVTTTLGWTLVSGGVAMGVTQWARGRRGILSLLLPVGLLFAGMSLLGGGFMHRRGLRIDEAEDHVREQLAALDPVARFRVLRDVGRDAMPFMRHARN